MELKDYIQSQIRVLRELGLWQYCSKIEKENMRHAHSEIEADRLVTTYRERYYDIMYADYEKSLNQPIIKKDDAEILSLNLSKRTTNVLMRNHLKTVKEFIDFVTKYGWSAIKGFGQGCAEDMFATIMDSNTSKDELLKLIKKLRIKEDLQ